MAWLANGQDVTLPQCQALAQFEGACTHPKTVAFEEGTSHNCYCSNTTSCAQVRVTPSRLARIALPDPALARRSRARG